MPVFPYHPAIDEESPNSTLPRPFEATLVEN
jgi:hypothetical protein